MKGYWKDPGATKQVLVDGYYRTGDQAFQDSEGYFYIVGRKDDLIKVKGHRINPREIEDVLMASGELVETAVLGVPDDLMGHKLIAFVVAKTDEYSQKEILSFCARKLPKQKLPGEVKSVRALPKSASGKIDRTKCMDLLK
jgi:long-chain acyl-CoA synthetase